MSDISERYRRLSADFSAKVAAVPPERWDDQSPCDDWTARDVVRHVVDTQGMFLQFVGRNLGELPSVEHDPLAAWESATAVVQADLEDPERAVAGYEGFSGPSTFEQGVDRFLCTDLVVHGWDLARTTGLDERMRPEEVQRVREGAEGFGEALRGPGAFGPEVKAPKGADDQDKLLAFLGRRP